MLSINPKGPISTIKIERPEVRNALNDELIARLHDAVISVPADCRAIVLTGEGSAFCAGGDLEWMKKAAAYTEDQNYEDALKLAELFQAIASCPQVVIARVNGHAFGGGAGLVAASDVAVASASALFAFSEVKLGLVAATISRHVLPKIGHGNARWLFSTGEAFSAEEARRIGLIHQVVEPDQLDEAVRSKLKFVLSAGPEAVAQSKALAQDGMDSRETEARLLAKMRAGSEAKEGISAFLEKRKANFVSEVDWV